MRRNVCQYCTHDHIVVAGYPGGCPFFGTAKAWDPGRPKAPRVEEVIDLAERQRDRQREVWRLAQAAKETDEREIRERQWIKRRTLMSVVKAEHQAEVAAQHEANMEELHAITDGRQVAEAHERRELARRLRGKLDR
jgi:hypothetical protein